MPAALPYVNVPGNIGKLFTKIAAAKVPEAFTHQYLYTTIGLKGKNDRALIPLLRTLGFIDQSGKPTPTYNVLKNDTLREGAIADAVREAYAPLFAADENANELSNDQLRGLVAQIAGTDQQITGRIVSTFKALTKLSDFSRSAGDTNEEAEESSEKELPPAAKPTGNGGGLRPEFHYNIQVHLPSNATEDVYLNIFNALRKVFG